MEDLANSKIDRQNIFNNRFAPGKIQEYISFQSMLFEGEYRFTKQISYDIICFVELIRNLKMSLTTYLLKIYNT